MPTLDQLSDASGWAVLVFVLLGGAVAFWRAWQSDAIVSGSRFREAQQTNRRLQAQVARDARTLAKLARDVATIADWLARHDRRALSEPGDPRGFHD